MSLNSQGNFRWVSPFYSSRNATGYYGQAIPKSLAIGSNGGILVGGYRNGLIDFQASNATSILSGESGGFLVSLNPTNGYLQWSKSFDATGGTVYVDALRVDSFGSIYVAGGFTGSADFDSSSGTQLRTSAGDVDAFLLKLNSLGGFGWIETLGGSGADSFRGVAIDGTQAIHLGGGIGPGSPVDMNFDPLLTDDLSPNQRNKGFRLKVRQA